MNKFFNLTFTLSVFLLITFCFSQSRLDKKIPEINQDNVINSVPPIHDLAALYTFSQLTTSFFSILGAPGEVVLGTGTLDDQTYPDKPVGFTFNYDSMDYSAFGVSANGYIIMGSGAVPTSYTVLNFTQNDVITAFDADLFATGSLYTDRISYLTSGTAPNRILTIQWTDFGFYPGPDSSHVTFQIKLYETTNIVQFVYGTCTSASTLHNVQAGIRGNSTVDVSSRTTTTNWAATTPGTSTSTVRFQIGVTPASGLTFQYTPPVVIPYLCESFSSTTFPPTGWTTVFSGTNYWSRFNVGAFCLGLGSAKFDFFDAPAATNQSLITPLFPPIYASNGCDSLQFSYAHSGFSSGTDILQIQTSTNGGVTWNEISLLSTQLNTAPHQTTAFTPSCAQWGRKSLVVPDGTNRIRFNAISMPDNNLYIDSICIMCITGIHRQTEQDYPRVYSIGQNYPNPFNPVTMINYQIPKNSFVSLKVYDILGNEVAILVNENKSAGNYEVRFDGTNLASGLYFYNIKAGDFKQTKKMLMLK